MSSGMASPESQCQWVNFLEVLCFSQKDKATARFTFRFLRIVAINSFSCLQPARTENGAEDFPEMNVDYLLLTE